MESVFKYFWIIAIVILGVNGLCWWLAGSGIRKKDPGLSAGYRRLILGFVAWGSLPWLVMGAGVLFGSADSLESYFEPSSVGPFVLAFHASVVLVWCVGFYWVFFAEGAEKYARHPGLLPVPPRFGAVALKIFWITGGVFIFVGMLEKIALPFLRCLV